MDVMDKVDEVHSIGFFKNEIQIITHLFVALNHQYNCPNWVEK